MTTTKRSVKGSALTWAEMDANMTEVDGKALVAGSASQEFSASTLSAATTIGVGAATPAASGAGITFPATQSASSDPNTLDDYEEGTWTPTVAYSTSDGNLSHTTRYGVYTKVGNLVTCTAYEAFGETTASGNLRLGGLPFVPANVTNQYCIAFVAADVMTGLAGSIIGLIVPNQSYLNIFQQGTGNLLDVAAANTGNPSYIRSTFSYFI